ncbi:MAG: hypothetical protein ACYTAO_14740 [Planctomycetota bacterium]|jgi:hypothetical protein
MRRTKPGQFPISDRRFPIDKSDVGNRRTAVSLCFLSFFLLAILFAGCAGESSGAGGKGQAVFSQEELSTPYDHIVLQRSLTIDALPKIQRFESERGPLLGGVEVLSRGESIAASLGQSKGGRKTWFNLVAFHEYKLNVIRKYFFLVDEDAARFPARVRRGLRFNCEMALDEDVLAEAYPSENARRIAILRRVLENLRKDIEELAAADSPGQDNKMPSAGCSLIRRSR